MGGALLLSSHLFLESQHLRWEGPKLTSPATLRARIPSRTKVAVFNIFPPLPFFRCIYWATAVYQIIKMDKVIMNSPFFLLTASLDYLPKPGSSLLLPLRLLLPWAALKAQVSFALNQKPFPDTFYLWFPFVSQLCTWYIMSAAFQASLPPKFLSDTWKKWLSLFESCC